jgi:hypothetical protein
MKKLLVLAFLATSCSAFLVFAACCGLPDGLLKGDVFSTVDTRDDDLSALKKDYSTMGQIVAASEDTISFWTYVCATLSVGSLLLDITLVYAIIVCSRKLNHKGAIKPAGQQ